MPEVTGYTAARMKQIEDNAVVSGAIVGNDLILTQHDGDTINAGVVVGPQGPTGATGPQGDVEEAPINGTKNIRKDAAWIALSVARSDLAASLHLTQTCTSTTRPSSPAAGWFAYETNTKRVIVYDATAAAWKYLHPRIQRLTFTTSFSSGAGSGTLTYPSAFTNTPIVLGHMPALITGNTPFALGFKNVNTTSIDYFCRALDGSAYNGSIGGNMVTVADYTDVLGYQDF